MERIAARLAGLAAEIRDRHTGSILKAGLLIVVAGGLWMTFDNLQGRVHALPRYERPLVLEWENLPDWLQLPDNQHILDSLAKEVALSPNDRQLDVELACRIGLKLSATDIGWIRQVQRVRVRPDGVVSVRCEFRRPAAWVKHGGYCYLVDHEAVRLPGRYDASDCQGTALMTLKGVVTSPPNVGETWSGADLSSGLRLVSLLDNKAFRHQVTSVIVANHSGRLDPTKPYVELATDRPGSRIWWGRPPEQEFGTEITATQKITLLETLYRQWGRIDMGRQYVNITTWPDRVAMPTVVKSPTPERLLRS